MPIFEFRCNDCGNTFEKLILISDGDDDCACPSCGGKDADRLMSFFSFGSRGADLDGDLTSPCSPSPGGFS
ncbi:MAG: zinc ribbon domain-containing protein [Thermodesulfobacteriota bacterium]|nr:zinc ribbon domain-containing protein [Thermodesulfobacteriota bacterium]